MDYFLQTVGTMTRFYKSWIQKLLEPIIIATGEKLFMNYTVECYLWGCEDPFLKKINSITQKLFNKTLVKNDKFGLFSGVSVYWCNRECTM
jgi:hypothetical protein